MEITSINQSIFIEVMGDSPINRILNFLDLNYAYDYSLTDIAKGAGVGYATLQLFWKKLESAKIVIQTRKVGKAKMYRLNIKNPVVKNFREFVLELCKSETARMFARK